MTQQVTVRGKILLPSNPASLPSPSFLKVKFADTSRACARAIYLAESDVEISEAYNSKGPDCLTYCLTGTPQHFISMGYTVSATLNVGWTPAGDEWLRKGDYLNDTRHTVPLVEGRTEYEVDVRLIHYNN